MKSLIFFDEFGPGMGLPSIKEKINKKSENKDIILKYLREEGRETGTSTAMLKDIFTGERIGSYVFKNDGEYSWITTIIYYIEKYDLEIPTDFERHVLEVKGGIQK